MTPATLFFITCQKTSEIMPPDVNFHLIIKKQTNNKLDTSWWCHHNHNQWSCHGMTFYSSLCSNVHHQRGLLMVPSKTEITPDSLFSLTGLHSAHHRRGRDVFVCFADLSPIPTGRTPPPPRPGGPASSIVLAHKKPSADLWNVNRCL